MFSPTLNDEFVEDPMEFGAGVRAAVDAVRQNRNEIGHRLRCDFSEKTDFDPSQPVASYFHVEVRHVGDRERLNILYARRKQSYTADTRFLQYFVAPQSSGKTPNVSLDCALTFRVASSQ